MAGTLTRQGLFEPQLGREKLVGMDDYGPMFEQARGGGDRARELGASVGVPLQCLASLKHPTLGGGLRLRELEKLGHSCRSV